ncbi:N-acetylmuramate alpha-1-phosphate uridylyltransferase MurU [Paludibacterium purpuratum]|uniref:MurNAc alpha-1-phosphate uridylyltransferase n=1 Tax=Paludibacterium purpuratum TaxID=1144873 RepID=A0A4R7B8T6_9NEIS|nr:nucleotidyltransferase family protein [Paludibacterium purpuratum]TDR80332.1 MurNAc alpha-1-phosphate uridylyltransferase [Paludibacterium purpuratum]
MKAMILAAGRGERMRPLTDHTPKPLLRVGAETLIGWHIRRLAACGIRELVINHAWLGERLQAALGDGAAYGVRIAWSAEHEALETAGGIAQALPLLGDAPFLLVNGDVLCDLDFARLMAAAQRLDGHARQAHLILVDNPPHRPGGDFTLHPDGRVTREPVEGLPRLTYAGIGAYHPSLLADLARRSPVRETLLNVFIEAMARGTISGERLSGLWLDVGTPERLQEADRIAAGWACP